MSGWLDSPNLKLLEKGLDASSLRQRVLADNIANVDTPGFKRSDVDFQKVLAGAMNDSSQPLALKQTLPGHLPGVNDSSQNAVVKDANTSLRNDGNNVDIDQEMTNIAKNELYYNGLTRALSEKMGILRSVIEEKP